MPNDDPSAARSWTKTFSDLHAQAGLGDALISKVTDLLKDDEQLRRAILPDAVSLSVLTSAQQALAEQERWKSLPREHWSAISGQRALLDDVILKSGVVSYLAEQERWKKFAGYSGYVEDAMRAARLTEKVALPDILETFRSPFEDMTAKFLRSQAMESLQDPAYISAFAKASAANQLYLQSTQVSRPMLEACQSLMSETVAIRSLSEYRGLLDASGLTLPRWPRVRRLSVSEKRRRFHNRMSGHVEPQHVKKAKSLVHRYELTLRGVLDDVMTEAFGENWAEERLPMCGCNDLIGKWKRRGGTILDNADYGHYAKIVSNDQHFAKIFYVGFEDPSQAQSLFIRAGNLRAASHHGRPFTPEDLRDLRLIWRAIETGLIALDEYIFED